MKVFISWSGQASKAIASALREWLPLVIQAIEPWMSGEDIEKGRRWRMDLDGALGTDVGIICLTPDNLNAPFILFEAGAIAKSVNEAHACTYLYNLKPGDIGEPLSAFQHTMATKDDTKKLIMTLNNALEDKALTEKKIDTIFERLWPDLEGQLSAIPKESGGAEPRRSTDDKIDEILLAVRSLQGVQNKTLADEEKMQAAAQSLFKIAKGRNLVDNVFTNLLAGESSSLSEPTSGGSPRATIKGKYHHVPLGGFSPDKKTSK